MSEVVHFYHQPPMKEDINLAEGQIKVDELTDLLDEFLNEKVIENITDKSIFIDIANEDIQLNKKKELIDKKCDLILSNFGGSIPDGKKLAIQNDELEYIQAKVKENRLLEESDNLLEKKKSEAGKLLNLWIEICKNTPQLKSCENIFDFNEIEEKENPDLIDYFNNKVEIIANLMNDH